MPFSFFTLPFLLQKNLDSKMSEMLCFIHILRFVCTVSSIVGFLCYALSSYFNLMYGKWNLWMIIPYTIFSSIICLIISLANKWRNSPSLWLKAHLVFLVLIITTVYSFFFDKLYEKPDVYSLVSSACFAIMSLCLSKLSNFGFEVDLVYFFCGYLTLQFVKKKIVLIISWSVFQLFPCHASFLFGCYN
ncbi:exocyst complex component EXO70B1 [Trifolium repens]|nr:exocyst complex component EXO70B1 [Trifolium repens]